MRACECNNYMSHPALTHVIIRVMLVGLYLDLGPRGLTAKRAHLQNRFRPLMLRRQHFALFAASSLLRDAFVLVVSSFNQKQKHIGDSTATIFIFKMVVNLSCNRRHPIKNVQAMDLA